MGNFDDIPRIREEEFFDHRTSAYDNERRLYDSLLSECYNINGVNLVYYAVTYDINGNRIWGEDTTREYERCFAFKGLYELPKEDNNTTPFGLEPFDAVTLYISKKHFEVASTYDAYGYRQPQLTAYKPKIGDMIKAEYNNFFYEIVDVAHEDVMFLQHKHSWTLILRPFKYEHTDEFKVSQMPYQQPESFNQGNFRSNFGGW
jgi:hypothetical protein